MLLPSSIRLCFFKNCNFFNPYISIFIYTQPGPFLFKEVFHFFSQSQGHTRQRRVLLCAWMCLLFLQYMKKNKPLWNVISPISFIRAHTTQNGPPKCTPFTGLTKRHETWSFFSLHKLRIQSSSHLWRRSLSPYIIMCIWTFTTEKFHTDMISKVMGCSSVAALVTFCNGPPPH